MLNRAFVAVTLAYLFAILLGWGATGVWVALVVGTCLDTLYMGLRWRGNTWRGVALRKTDLYRQHLRHLPEAIQEQYLRDIRQPLMAEPTTREHVNPDRVVCTLPDREVTVQFDEGRYQIL